MQLCLETSHMREHFGRRPAPRGTSPLDILNSAGANGIRCFDAAGAYDEAEKILGRFMGEHPSVHFDVTTKIRPNVLYSASPERYMGILRQNLASSLRNLGQEGVYACLFHNAAELHNERALEALWRLKREGLTAKVGVCTSDPSEFEHASDSPYVDVIQISYNVLDTRLDYLLAHTDKIVQAGNVFLDGILLADEDDLPQHLWEIKPYLHTLSAYCERYGVTRRELALTFVKTQPKISQVILDAQSTAQVRADCEVFQRTGNVVALRELPDQLGGIDERFLAPNLWKGEVG